MENNRGFVWEHSLNIRGVGVGDHSNTRMTTANKEAFSTAGLRLCQFLGAYRQARTTRLHGFVRASSSGNA